MNRPGRDIVRRCQVTHLEWSSSWHSDTGAWRDRSMRVHSGTLRSLCKQKFAKEQQSIASDASGGHVIPWLLPGHGHGPVGFRQSRICQKISTVSTAQRDS